MTDCRLTLRRLRKSTTAYLEATEAHLALLTELRPQLEVAAGESFQYTSDALAVASVTEAVRFALDPAEPGTPAALLVALKAALDRRL